MPEPGPQWADCEEGQNHLPFSAKTPGACLTPAGVLPLWTGIATAVMATGHGPEKLSTSRFIGHTRVNTTISRLLSIADS